MLSLDTVKFKVPLDSVQIQKIAKFGMNVHYNSDGEIDFHTHTLTSELVKSVIGLSHISYTIDSMIIEMSAKTLLDDYNKGITMETLLIAFSKFDHIVKILNYDWIEVLRCDITTNIYMEDARKAIDTLRLGRSNTGFKVEDYRTVKNNGIAFIGTQKSYKNRQIYYNKRVEMSQAKNRPFFAACKNPGQLYNSMQDVLRVEQNLTSFSQLRKATGVEGEIFLDKLLQSKRTPLLIKHKEIMKFAKEITIFDEWGDVPTIQKAIEYIGYEGMLNQCGGDLNLAIDFLGSFVEKNPKQRSTFFRYKKALQYFYSGFYIKRNPDMDLKMYSRVLSDINNKLEEKHV